MSATIELFESYKTGVGARTDGAGAASLGVTSQTVSNWRNRGSQAEPQLIEKMCATLNEDLASWLLRAQMEQASSANRQVWHRVAEKLSYRIAGAILAVGLPATEASGFAETPFVYVSAILARMGAWADLCLVA